MTGQVSVLAKVFIFSALGSAVIKYGFAYGLGRPAIAPSQLGALIAILLPAVMMAGGLWWRSRQAEH